MARDSHGCKRTLDSRPSFGTVDCIEGFKKNDLDSRCYSTRVPQGVTCSGKLCGGECPEGWTMCENFICTNAPDCSADFDDDLTEIRVTLRDILMDKSADHNGRWLDLADYPEQTFNLTMCQH